MQKYSGPWTNVQLKHLLRRTLYGVTANDMRFFKDKSMEECIAILLTAAPEPHPPVYYEEGMKDGPRNTTWVFGPPDSEEKEMYRALLIKVWLLELIQNQKNSVTDRMTMFWNNHFATESAKVKDSRYSYQYFALLRKYATGNFRTLLHKMTTNPKMLVYLDGNLNNKAAPNENYGREVQELFTVGKGPDSHYIEEDVKNAAKVLTGWKDDKDKINSYFNPDFHDTADKTFSSFYNNHTIKGRSGADGAAETFEMLDMLCNNGETAKFLCRKLYRWFVASNIDEQVENKMISPMAEIMVKANYEIQPVLKALLSSSSFYEPDLIGGIIKSPIDFMGEVTRSFPITNEFFPTEGFRNLSGFCFFIAGIGQDMGEPPSVAGWPAYYAYPLFDKEWIPSDRLYERNHLFDYLSSKPNSEVPESNTHYDLIATIAAFANPGKPQQLLAEAIDLYFCVPLGSGQLTYLQSLLNKGITYKQNWNELWAMYSSSKDKKEDLAEEVKDRLRITFKTMLTFPEYQIR